MTYEILEKKIKELPSQALNEVEHYIDYILKIYSSQDEIPLDKGTNNLEQPIIRQPGLLRGKIKIADDFDDMMLRQYNE